MKLIKLAVLASLALGSFTQASTVNFANGTGRGNVFFLADGTTRVATGSLVEVGFYAVVGDATSAFTLFGTTSLSDPGGGVLGGHIPAAGKSVVSTLSDGNATFEGKAFVLRVYNAVTIGAATQMGVFNAPTLWTTPGAGGFNDSGDSFLMTVGSNVTPGQTGITALDPDGVGPIAAGSFAVGSVTIGATTNTFASVYKLGLIAAVPEPSSLALIGCLGLIGFRRRR